MPARRPRAVGDGLRIGALCILDDKPRAPLTQAERQSLRDLADCVEQAIGHVDLHEQSVALQSAQRCGYAHVQWAPAGFLGDELPSETHPNDALLAQALRNVRDGDVLMAHLGIWSRRDPFAPMIDPLVAGLKRGDTVVLSNGMIGKVTRVEADQAMVEIAQGVNVAVVKQMITQVRDRTAVAANDTKTIAKS